MQDLHVVDRYFVEELELVAPPQADDDLIEAGLVDSVMVMDFVFFISDEIGVQLTAADLGRENFQTVSRIRGLIDTKSAGQGTGQN